MRPGTAAVTLHFELVPCLRNLANLGMVNITSELSVSRLRVLKQIIASLHCSRGNSRGLKRLHHLDLRLVDCPFADKVV